MAYIRKNNEFTVIYNLNMKSIFTLLGSLLLSFGLAAQLTIVKNDLQFSLNKQWNHKVISTSASSLDLTIGTGKTWDFSAVPGSSSEQTVVSVADNQDVILTSSLKGDFKYKVVDTTYTYASLSGVDADNPYSVSVGLPHYYGKSWSGSATGLGGFATASLVGDVIAEGVITTALGTEPCLLVREVVQSSSPIGSANETRYYWETAANGRIATFYDKTDELLVAESVGLNSGPSYGSGWETTKDELYWGMGKEVVGEFVGISEFALGANYNLSGGDSLSWDFTSLYGTGYLDTAKVYFDDGSLVKVKSSSKVDQYFKHADSTFTLVKIQGVEFDDKDASTIGLPHRYGKKWASDNTIFGGTVQVKFSGEVIGRGTVKIGLGTFPCLIVKEITTGGANGTNYYWETKEHGRVAAWFSQYDELVIMRARYSTPAGSSTHKEVASLLWENGVAGLAQVYGIDSLSNVLNLVSGQNLSWNFSSLPNPILDSVTVKKNERVHYDLKLGSAVQQAFYEEGGTLFYESIEGFDLDTPNTATLGLPYVYGKEWFCYGAGNKSGITAEFQLSGKVIADGKITLEGGTFDCVLVQEDLAGGISATNYYWCTAEHGRVASYFDATNQLVVKRTAASNHVEGSGSAVGYHLFPNPTSSEVFIVGGQQVDRMAAFDQMGQIVKQCINCNQLNVNGVSAGLYLFQIVIGNDIYSESLVVK